MKHSVFSEGNEFTHAVSRIEKDFKHSVPCAKNESKHHTSMSCTGLGSSILIAKECLCCIVHTTTHCYMYRSKTRTLLCSNSDSDINCELCKLHDKFLSSDQKEKIFVTLHGIANLVLDTIDNTKYEEKFPGSPFVDEPQLYTNLDTLLDDQGTLFVVEIRTMCKPQPYGLYFGIIINGNIQYERVSDFKYTNKNKDELLHKLLKDFVNTQYDFTRAIVTVLKPPPRSRSLMIAPRNQNRSKSNQCINRQTY